MEYKEFFKKPRHLIVGGALLLALIVVLVLTLSSGSMPSTVQNTNQVNGEPTLTLEAPITTSGCTLNNTCFVLGSSSGTGTGATAGQVFSDSTWRSVTLPRANTPTIQGASCWGSGCLIYGSTIEGDLLWRFSAASMTMTAVKAPSQSAAVEGVSCFGSRRCAVIDMGGTNSAPQFFITTDAGTTWSAPTATPFDATSLACTSSQRCVAASSSAVWSTVDGGASWKELSHPAGTLVNLYCTGSTCVANDTNTAHDHLWQSTDFGKNWTSTTLANRTFAFACLNVTHCVSAGQTPTGTGSVTNILGTSLSDLSVNYFPNPITTAACGTSRCVVGGLYSVALFRP